MLENSHTLNFPSYLLGALLYLKFKKFELSMILLRWYISFQIGWNYCLLLLIAIKYWKVLEKWNKSYTIYYQFRVKKNKKMSDFPVGLREVVPNQTVPEKCREFSINTGKILNSFKKVCLTGGKPWPVKIEKNLVNIL